MLMGTIMFSMGAFAQVESNQTKPTEPINPGIQCYIYPLSNCDENGNSTGDMLGPLVTIYNANYNAAGKAEKQRIYCETGVIADDCPR